MAAEWSPWCLSTPPVHERCEAPDVCVCECHTQPALFDTPTQEGPPC
jgi:hypothetical protein